jgi:hypothetical protein
MSFLRDLFAQVFSNGARIDAQRYCVYNGFLGLLLLAGAFALRLSGPLGPIGAGAFSLVIVAALVLAAALVVPSTRPGLVPTLLATQGVVIVAMTLGFAFASVFWALGGTTTRAFKYLPGLIVVAMTYGSTLWADYGPARARPRPWRLAGFITGIALEAAVGALVVGALVAT